MALRSTFDDSSRISLPAVHLFLPELDPHLSNDWGERQDLAMTSCMGCCLSRILLRLEVLRVSSNPRGAARYHRVQSRAQRWSLPLGQHKYDSVDRM